MASPSPAKLAKAKGEIRAALEAFRASCRSRQARYLALLRELRREHDRDANALYRADRKFVEAVDPERRVREQRMDNGEPFGDELFVNWSPGEVEVPDRDYVGDAVPGGDVSDALDDVDSFLDQVRDDYAPDDG